MTWHIVADATLLIVKNFSPAIAVGVALALANRPRRGGAR